MSLSVQFSSVTHLCLTICNPMDCSTSGFPILDHLPELAQTLVHWVNDAIQRSHPIIPFSGLQSFPASESFSVSQLLASGGYRIGASASASVLLMNIHWWWVNNRTVFQEPFNAHTEVITLHLGSGGLGSYRRPQRYHYIIYSVRKNIYSLRKNQDSIPHLHFCFLIAAPFFLHFLPSLISNCLKLPFRTQGSQGGWMKLISYEQETRDMEGICTSEGLSESYSISQGFENKLPCDSQKLLISPFFLK